MILFSKGHRIVSFDSIELPLGQLPCFPVDDIDHAAVLRNVHENARSLLFQLERLRVAATAFEILPNMSFRHRINHRDAADDAHKHAL